MKKILLSLFLLSCYLIKAEKLPGYYVTNNFDTIQCTIKIPYGDFAQLTKRVSIVDNEGKKKFFPQDIVCFCINKSDSEIYKFVSLKDFPSKFYHEIAFGKISLYKIYSTNLYHGVLQITIVAIKNNKLVKITAMDRKQIVTDLISDNPAILEKWNAVKFSVWTNDWNDTTELEKIIGEYNEFEPNDK